MVKENFCPLTDRKQKRKDLIRYAVTAADRTVR
jgi:hypothetical protein